MGGVKKARKRNVMSVFEYPFDYERYMGERLREIEDMEERLFAKKVISTGFGSVIRSTEEKYRKLEHRIFEEIETQENYYTSYSTIIDRTLYAPDNIMLFPVCEEDLDEAVSRNQLSNETTLYLETVYIELSEQDLICFKQDTKFLKGKIYKEGCELEVDLELRPACRYRDMVERLYNVFRNNDIAWNTINTAYMDKFFDIFLCLENEIKRSVAVNCPEVQITFGKWITVVRHGFIPLWNVQKISFGSTGFMTPSADGIHYEHEFIPEYDKQNGGYVVEQNEHILEIRHENEKIVLSSDLGTFEDWIAYRFVQASSVLTSDYSNPVLSNRKKESFMRSYAEKMQNRLLTKTELFRRIMELDIKEYLEISDYQILENSSGFPMYQSMNWFIKEELFPMESRKILLLIFKEKKAGFYLNETIMNFIISQMQMEINEYRCVGKIKTAEEV